MRKKTLGSIEADDGQRVQVLRSKHGFVYLSTDGKTARDDSFGMSTTECDRALAVARAALCPS